MSKHKEKSKEFWAGFKSFISKGNLLDLAVAVVIGATFTAITASLVNDIIMPFISAFLGSASIEELSFSLTIWRNAEPTIIYYGRFLQAIILFLLTAFVLYTVVKVIIQKRKDFIKKPIEVVIPQDIKLLTEINESLKKLSSNQKSDVE